ncbi:MAG: hypothetical protein ACE5JL_03935, partial [Dehalococcoidia bacterium]
AFSAAAIAAGVVMWAVILITVPVSRTGDGPQEPTVTKVEALNAALREANIQLPDYVEVVKVDALATPAVDI